MLIICAPILPVRPDTGGPTITPGGPTVTPVPGQIGTAVGGDHIWNGLISAVIDFINKNASTLLGPHVESSTLAFGVNNLWTVVMSFGYMVQALQMTTIIPALFIWGIMLTIEAIRWVFVAYRTIVRLFPMP